MAQCNELLMNLDHVIADDDVRADIDKINKVRRPERVLASHASSPCSWPVHDLVAYRCVCLFRRVGSREVEEGSAEAGCVTRSSCLLAAA